MALDAGAGRFVVTGEFDEPAEARQAMVALEQLGLDADAIRLVGVPATVPVEDVDRTGELDAGGSVVRRYATGGVIGAVVGAAIMIVVLAIAGADGGGLLGGAIAGAIGGFLVGGFWAGARKLPVNVDALDTFTVDRSASTPVTVEVSAPDAALAERSAEALRAARARRVEQA